MTRIDEALDRLRASASPAPDRHGALSRGWERTGVRFAAVGGGIERRWNQAVDELDRCIRPSAAGDAVLHEGGVYHGAWIESTGTINAEVLDRFAPDVTQATHLLFAEHQRADGLIPYKVTPDGPAYSQIQIVTPLARCVWNHYRVTHDGAYLRRMYEAMARYDDWLATYRDTRGTGGVEAFCVFDTGHDQSPRFWFAPERCRDAEASRVDPASPTLPYVAPDLTANVACQRAYLAEIAVELGEDAEPWRQKAQDSLDALWRHCWDEADGIFYDEDRHGRLVRVASDVLLRVLACEVGDDAFFARALERYLMNTRKFLAHFGFTSVAMDDPRFDHDHTRNSWGGPVNFLALLRAPHAFEAHARSAELAVASLPVLAALIEADRFPQCLDPWTGEPGYTEMYSPSLLWMLDAVERWFGVLPRPDGEVWFSGLTPTRLVHGAAEATAYRRVIGGVVFELVGDDERVVVLRDGAPHLEFPRGLRVIADARGVPAAVEGLSPVEVRGELVVDGERLKLRVGPNERVGLGVAGDRRPAAFVAPVF